MSRLPLLNRAVPLALCAALSVGPAASPLGAQTYDDFYNECGLYAVTASSLLQNQAERNQSLLAAEASVDAIILYLRVLSAIAEETSCGISFEAVVEQMTGLLEADEIRFARWVELGMSDLEVVSLMLGRVDFCYRVLGVPGVTEEEAAGNYALPCGWEDLGDVMPEIE
ncbi:hypothetical protein HKCCE4037_01315 [Rhodobacterales bacterium HKCCE4037]|nr:hypothetical protein [Rhodobacterales bacterium HKCCE4037]